MKRTLVVAALLATSLDCRTTPPFENVNAVGKSGGAAPGGKSTASSGGPRPADPAPGFDKNALLAAAADCAIAQYRAFDGAAKELVTASQAWADQPADDARRTAARTAWGKAMDAWQEAEPFLFGPAAPSSNPGGKDLRDQIYAWPLFNRCKIDETIADGSFATPAFASALVSSRGLGTYEYLAFYEGTDNGCSQFSVINSSGSWAALSPTDLRARRARYVAAVAADAAKQAGALLQAWDPAGANFRDELAKAGAGSGTYATTQDALNAVNDGLFFVEIQVKDLKLARPLGLTECGAVDCATTAESVFARRSKENIKRDLVGFRRLFQGCGAKNEGLGFDDWLIAAGARDTADRMLAALTAADDAVELITPTLEDALANHSPSVEGLYAPMKTLTTLLKTEFISVLNLELPKVSEGDND